MYIGIMFLRRLGALSPCDIYRQLSTTSSLRLESTNNVVRRFLIQGNQSRKRKRYHQPSMLNPSELAKPQAKGERNSHRVKVLNKVFLEKICDILSTGEIAPLFSGYGLEISKVQVLSDMSGINVHWFCTGSTLDNKLEKILKENSYILRDELTKQRVIGRVPLITFVKDHRYYKVMEVERLLAIADYGEDFEPTDPTHQVKSSGILKTQLDENLKNAMIESESLEVTEDFFTRALRLQSLQSSEREEPPLEDMPHDLPQMRSDIFGVDTQKIFKWVRQRVTKSQAERRKIADEFSLGGASEHKPDLNIPMGTTRTEEIRQWASKYEQMKKKERQRRKKEADCILSMYPQSVENQAEDIQEEEEEDFLEENIEY